MGRFAKILKTPFRVLRDKAYERRRNRNQKKLTNHNFTIISNRCIGGMLYHACKEQFRSPTINLSFGSLPMFVAFSNNLPYYLSLTMEDHGYNEELQCPMGILRSIAPQLPDVIINFDHYSSFEDAKTSWERRSKRVNYHNLIFIVFLYDATQEDIDLSYQIQAKDLLVFSNLPSTNADHPTIYNSCFDNYSPGKIYIFKPNSLSSKKYLDEFAYVDYFNTHTGH